MKKIITGDMVSPLFESKFLNVYDLRHEADKHYLDASRRKADNLVATKDEEAFSSMLPDAVSCVVIFNEEEPKLLLTKEYRYPIGRFLLSPPAGLMDAADRFESEPIITTAVREIFEETGIRVTKEDDVHIVNRCLFSSPGMTDECNALVCVVINSPDRGSLTTEGAEGGELFDGLKMLTRADVSRILENGSDDEGIYYSVYTWAAMMYFMKYTSGEPHA